jgi:hypothetical protein
MLVSCQHTPCAVVFTGQSGGLRFQHADTFIFYLFHPMYLVAIAWLYVAVMMTVAEATHPTGTLLGAAVTFVLYGALPVALLMYILNTPHRRRARKAAELAQAQPTPPTPPEMPPSPPKA